MKSKYSILTIAVLALMIAGMAVSLASAATGTYSLSVTSGSAGTVTQASASSGSGWNGGATATLKWDDGVTVLGSASTNGAGKWSVYITIPSSATAGAHTITANDGQGTTGTATFTVTVSAVTMTVSYHVNDATAPSAAPVFHYKDTSGLSKTYTLTGSAHAVTGIGAGLAWSVDTPIGSGNEQWAATTVSGNAPATGSSTTIINYNHQLKVTFDASNNVKADSTSTIVTVAGSAKKAETLPFTTEWINSGDTLTYSYQGTVASPSSSSTQYLWSSTSGLSQTSQATTFTITSPGTVTGAFTSQYSVHYAAAGNTVDVGVPSDEWVSANDAAVGTFPATVTNQAGDTRCNFISDNRPLHVTSPITVTGTYQTQYQLTVSSLYGSPAGAGWINAGDSAAFNVTTPNLVDSSTQNVLLSWTGTGTGAYSGSIASSTVTMNNPITETANWKTQYKVTFEVTPSLSGTTTPATSTWYDAGSSLNPLTASANGGYAFSSWTKTGSIALVDPTLVSTTFSLADPGTITANFQAQNQDTQTQITILYSPGSANPTDQITISGKLTLASDPAVGIPNREITLSYFDGENWNSINTTTDSEGSYSVQWIVPEHMAAGPQLIKAVFAGDPQGTSPQYQSCESTSGGIGLFVLPEYSLGGIVAFVMCFGAFAVFRNRKKRQSKLPQNK